MIKKLFCNHSFNHFHTSEYLMFLVHVWDKKYHYVCKECGKVKVLIGDGIDSYGNLYSKQVAKEKAMGIDHSEYDGYSFKIGDSIYTGKLGYLMEKRFGKYKH